LANPGSPLANLRQLEVYAINSDFHHEWREVKDANKRDLAEYFHTETGVVVNPDSPFDIQVKRLHEYKRQHLKILHIVALNNLIKQNPGMAITPRTFIFGGKAAPGYFITKLIIKLIHSVAEVVNNVARMGKFSSGRAIRDYCEKIWKVNCPL
jgi:glycogen phosphorylase